MGNSWKIERKYRRILNKRLAGKVRTHVREQQEKIENAEKLAKNERRLMAKEVAKMVQREFWSKVERKVVSDIFRILMHNCHYSNVHVSFRGSGKFPTF